jgi:hypothetical protein
MPQAPDGDGSSPIVAKVLPITQTISWNRADPVPNINKLTITNMGIAPVDFCDFSIQFENTSIEWLHSNNQIDGYVDFSTGVSGNLPLQFKNLNQLTGSSYKAKIYINLSNVYNYTQLYSTINLLISGTAPNVLQTDKTNYNLIFNRSENTLSGETHIDILNNTNNDIFTLDTVGTYFLPQSSASGFDISDHPNLPLAANPDLPQNGTKIISCRLQKNGQFFYYFTITMVVIDSGNIFTIPDSLDFQLRKGFDVIIAQNLKIVNPLNKPFSVTAPNWLNLSAISGNSTKDITVETIPSENISAGDYWGEIQISVNGNITASVPVHLSVISFVDLDLKDYNFCLDGVNFHFNKIFENAVFAKVNLKIEFVTSEGTSVINSAYSVPYFNGKSEFDMGEKVQNYFPIFDKPIFSDSPIFDNKMVYQPAKIYATVEELDVNYNVLHSKTLPDFSLFAGKKPAKFPLFTNFGMRRKYDGSACIFSYYSGLANALNFKKPSFQSNPEGIHEVQTAFISKETILNFNFIKNNFGVEFLPFPKVQKQAVLQWLNNNLVPEFFIFSGSYKISNEIDQTFDNFQKNGKKYDSKELSKITISTGFILKEESGLIKEIVKSPISFLKIEDEIYRCFCISTKLTQEDSERNLIQFELEFQLVDS